MAKVQIYTTQVCPYCVQAKRLLTKKGVPVFNAPGANANAAAKQAVRIMCFSRGR